MEERLRAWWQKVSKPLGVFGIIVVSILIFALLAVIVMVYVFNVNVPGLRGKTLWDWMQLLIIPAVLALGGYLFTYNSGRTEREIASERQQDAALQAYLDRMTELLLEKGLRQSALSDEVRSVARLRTLSVLHQLDGGRKRNIIQFLHEADLLSVISLQSADLSGADLHNGSLRGADLLNVILVGANLKGAIMSGIDLRKSFLRGANLHEADLRISNLSDADLRNANLRGPDLHGSNLNRADLRKANLLDVDLSETYLNYANLRGATVTDDQLKKAKRLQGATMPDGSIHP